MQVRKEYKYLVEISKIEALRKALAPFVELDKYAAKNDKQEYKVRSIYFDTGKMNYYHEKDAGVKIRKKFRIRGYEQVDRDSIIFLEVKRKNNEIVSKNRAPVYFKNLHELLETRQSEQLVTPLSSFPKAVYDADVFLYYLYRQYLVPVILIVYDREPFVSKFNSNLRITFDKNIRSKVTTDINGLSSEHKNIFALSQYFVLEIKFDFGYPIWLKQIIKEFGLVRQAVSKYCICVDKHIDEIGMLFRHPSIEFFNNSISNEQVINEVLTENG